MANINGILIETEMKLRELFDEIEIIMKNEKIQSGTKFEIIAKYSKILVVKK